MGWDAARDLVMRHGWNTTCYQILNPGIEHWFSARGDAVVGYVRCGKTFVVAGAPVCAEARVAEVMAEWEARAGRVCYFAAEQRVFRQAEASGRHTTVVLGAQPVWSPQTWAGAFAGDKTLRAQLHRSRNKGVVVREVPPEGDLALQRLLDQWLSHKGLPPLHFLVEPDTLGRLGDRRLFVAERAGEAVGFVVLAPIPQRQGWLTEQFVRGDAAPNGTIELALDAAIRTVGGDGSRFVTMGIVPLSPHADTAGNPAWLRPLASVGRKVGRRLYNFEGLDRFKSKFHPDYWEPIYVVSNERHFSPASLHAVASAFTEGHPFRAVAKGLARSITVPRTLRPSLPAGTRR